MIELEGISKSYTSGFLHRQRKIVVRNASFTIGKGETMGLIGESGSGKTTLGRIVLRLAEPTAGTVWFDGTELTALRGRALQRIRPRMQIVFQDPDTALNPRMTAGESVAEPLRIWQPAGRHAIDNRVAELLELVGLQPELAARRPFETERGAETTGGAREGPGPGPRVPCGRRTDLGA